MNLRGFVVIVLCILVVVPSVQSFSSKLMVEATQSDFGVNVTLVPAGASSLALSVSHEDVAGVRVLDWVGMVRSTGSDVVEVALENLPRGAEYEVDVWGGDARFAGVSSVSKVPVEFPGEVPIASVKVPVVEQVVSKKFVAYPVSLDRASEASSRIFSTPSGALVVVWVSEVEEPGPLACRLQVARSLDGGHSFSVPWEVTRSELVDENWGCRSGVSWAATTLMGGTVAIVWDARGDVFAANVTLFDPTSGFVARPVLSPALHLRGASAAASSDTGGILLSSTTLMGQFVVWSVGLDGSTSLVEAADAGGWVYSALGASNDSGVVDFVWANHNRVWTMRSRDGGASFGQPVLIPLGDHSQLELESAHLTAGGTLHVVASDYASGHGQYARIPSNGVVMVRPLCGDELDAVLEGCHRAQNAMLIASDSFVWLMFERFQGSGSEPDDVAWVATESRTDGVSFAPPYLLEDRTEQRLSTPLDMTLTADGRPVLYASMFFQSTGSTLAPHAVMPFFDPLAPTVSVRNATIRAPAQSVVQSDSDGVLRWSAEGEASRMYLAEIKNVGSRSWHNVTLTVGNEEIMNRAFWVTPGGSLRASVQLPEGIQGRVAAQLEAGGALVGEPVLFLASGARSMLEGVPLNDTSSGGREVPVAPLGLIVIGVALLGHIRRHGGA